MQRNTGEVRERVESRSAPPILMKKPPTYPVSGDITPTAGRVGKEEAVVFSSPGWDRTPVGKENFPDMMRRLEEMRDMPILSRRIFPRKDTECPTQRPLVRPNGELEELEGILMYVECVTASLSHRARAPAPPENILRVQSSLVASRRAVNSDEREGSPQVSIPVSLHDASNNFINWFSKLEYVSLSTSTTLHDIDRHLKSTASDAVATLEAIERRYSSHEVPDVREFFYGSKQTLEECRRVVKCMQEWALQLLAIRRVVNDRNLSRVRRLLEELKKKMQENHSTDLASARASSPYLMWLENKWIPAMTAWDRIVIKAKGKAASGDVADALTTAQQEALASSSLLSEILRPRETLSDLVRDQLETPFTKMAESLKLKNDSLNALRSAIASVRTSELSDCVCALDKFAATGELSSAERALHKEGKKLVIRVQQVENVEAALRLAAEVGETVTLFRTIHQANGILFELGIAGDVTKNKEVVERCTALIAEMESTRSCSPSEFIARRVDATAINIAHVPSMLWTAVTTSFYQSACQRLTTRIAQDLARMHLERLLDTSGDDVSHLNRTVSSIGDDASNTSAATPPADSKFLRTQSQMPLAKVRELRLSIDHAKQVGLSGAMVQQGEARLRAAEAVKIKVHFEAQLRVLRLTEPEKITFDVIYEKLYELCTQQEEIFPRLSGQRLRIRYQDSDGDHISILSHEDWAVYMAEFAPDGLPGAKLELYCDFPPVPQPREVDALVPTPQSHSPRPENAESKVTPNNTPNLLTPSGRTAALRSSLLPPSFSFSPHDGGVPHYMRLTRSRSAGFPLAGRNANQRRGRNGTPVKRTAMDDMALRRGSATDTNTTEEHEGEHVAMETPEVGQFVRQAITPVRRGANRIPSVRLAGRAKRTTPVRVRTNETPATCTGARTVAPKTTPTLDVTGAKKWTDDDPRLELQTVASITSTLPQGRKMGVQKAPDVKPWGDDGQTTLEFVPSVISTAPCSGAGSGKRWTDDDNTPLELQTVMSVTSTLPKNVVSSKLATRQGNTFTVTPVRGSVGGSKSQPTLKQRQQVQQQLPLKEPSEDVKREWSADMFMMSEIRTVVSDITTPPTSMNNRTAKKQTENTSKAPAPTTTNTTTPSTKDATLSPETDLKKKTETLRQLRIMRAENQKALKAALHQRRTGKN